MNENPYDVVRDSVMDIGKFKLNQIGTNAVKWKRVLKNLNDRIKMQMEDIRDKKPSDKKIDHDCLSEEFKSVFREKDENLVPKLKGKCRQTKTDFLIKLFEPYESWKQEFNPKTKDYLAVIAEYDGWNDLVDDFKYSFKKKKELGLDQDISIEKLKKNVVSHIIEDSSLLNSLREGSKSYFEQRYSQLNISEILIPKWKKENIDTDVKVEGEENVFSLINGVEKLWQGKTRNCLLIGEGGMGKTYSLVQIWKHYLNTPKSPIPIFVSLNRYNDVTEKERESFITNYIIENYFQKRFFSNTDKEKLWKLILNNQQTQHKEKPVIILLLDGFNEITVSQTNIRKDIDDWWFQKAKGVQIIISSRYDMRLDYRWNDLQKIDLQPLNEETISKYLSVLDIETPTSKELLSLLSNPMMLTLFASTDEIISKYSKYPKFVFKLEFTSQGELMWNFFEGQLVKYFEAIKYNDTEFAYYSFLLKHFIPYIGFEMEKMGLYHIQENKLIEIINKGCVLFFTENFENTFPTYRSHIAKFDLADKQFPQTGVRFQKIIDILCGKLQILIQENHSYKFLHQNFRDFSASVHHLNDISLALVQKSVPPSLKNRPLPLYVQKFIGEIEGEHKKKVKINKKKEKWMISHTENNLLARQLDELRGVFDEVSTEYAIRNIVDIIKQSRNDLTGCDLSNLNLKYISFNNVRCFRKWNDSIIGVSFDKSLVTVDNFSNQGMHSGSVNAVSYSPDGTKFVSGSYDKTVKEWLVETGEYLKTYKGFKIGIECVVYSNDGKKILSSEGHYVNEIVIESGKLIEYYSNVSPTCLTYSPDDKTFVCGSSGGAITEWSVGKRFCNRTIGEKPSSVVDDRIRKEIEIIRYSADGKEIITHSMSGIIKKWSVSTGKCLETHFEEKRTIDNVAYSSDFKKRLRINNGFSINEYEVDTGKLIMNYEADDSIRSFAYSPNEERIVAGLSGGQIQQWSTISGQKLSISKAFSSEIRCATYSSDNKRIIAYFADGYAREWLISTKKCINSYFINARHYKNCITYSPNSEKFAISSDCDVLEYSTETGELIQKYGSASRTIKCIAYSSDGKKIITGGGIETKVWLVTSGECIRTFKKPLSDIIFITFCPSGDRFATISEHASDINEWDADSGEFIKRYSGYYNHLVKIKYNLDGKRLISFSKNNKICKWDVKTGEMLSPYNKPRYFSPGSFFEKFNDVNTYLDICNDGDKVLSYQESSQILEEFSLTGETFFQNKILFYAGLLINDCSFKNLHPDSNISENFKIVMLQYGAVF